MIIDTSALVAILDQEPEADRIVRTVASAPERTLSAANLVETGIVMQARRRLCALSPFGAAFVAAPGPPPFSSIRSEPTKATPLPVARRSNR